MARYILCLILLALVACRQQDKAFTVIRGENIHVQGDKVYLTTGERNALVLDSAKVVGGTFRIVIPHEALHFRACLAYRDDVGKFDVFRFLDSDSADSARHDRYHSDYLAIEAGVISIAGLTDFGGGQRYAFLKGHQENSLLFNPGFRIFNVLEDSLAEDYDKTVQKMDVLMRTDLFSRSMLVLERIWACRYLFSKRDLQAIVSSIDPKLNLSIYTEYLGRYLAQLPDNFDPNETILLDNGKGGKVNIYDRRKALNMLIFSATWSHPSALLLHYLKGEQQAFSHPDLYCVDIGLDEDKSWWESKLINGHEKNWGAIACAEGA